MKKLLLLILTVALALGAFVSCDMANAGLTGGNSTGGVTGGGNGSIFNGAQDLGPVTPADEEGYVLVSARYSPPGTVVVFR